ncbi:MAG TPA: cytochrome c, partial [Blastocatellia bacterium]|nr:cytochrome c [Blastocatellia bacterium]
MKNSEIKKAALVAIVVAGLGFCLSGVSASPASVTFSKDVAPILQKRCEECHREGGVAPMSFTSYEEARPWARAIKERVVRREMPPFHALGAVGRYHEDPRLTDAEIATIRDWVDGGAKKGDAKLLPQRRVWKDDWAFGQPDLTVSHPRPFPLNKTDKDLYVFFIFDHVFPEETWISSIQVRPGNARIVHHANVHLVPPGFKAPPEGYVAGDFDPSARGTIMISGWVPGTNAVRLAEG